MSKKVIKLVVSLVVTCVLSVSMVIVGNNLNKLKYEEPSETFLGALSTYSYASKTDTVKAFLNNELTGATEDPVYSGYEKLNDLSTTEIENLNISDSIKTRVQSAEKIAVFYTSGKAVSKMANTYLLKLDDGYHYYVSASADGEALTNTYFNTVLDGHKYLNCTGSTTMNLRLIGDDTFSEATYRQVFKFDYDIAYFDQEIPGLISKVYFVDMVGRIEPYLEHPAKDDGKFYSLTEINKYYASKYMEYNVFILKGGDQINIKTLKTIEEITDLMFMMELDASYFVKTPYGFSMPNEKYMQVCRMLLGEEYYDEINQAWNEYHIYFNADYYVSQGRLSANKLSLTMSNGSNIYALTITAEYTDFGTTDVTLPDSQGDK